MFVIKIAVKCILEEKGKILLMKEASGSSWRPGTWSLPGGKIEPNETFTYALSRELKEETGLKVKINSLFRIEEIILRHKGDERLVHHLVFIGKIAGGKLKKEDRHTAGFRWLSANQILKIPVKNLSEFYYKDLFKEYFKNRKNEISLSKIKVWNGNKNKRFNDWL